MVLPMKMVIEKLTPIGEIVWPIILINLLMYSRSIVSMLFLGHLGNLELAGGSLSISFANITGYSVLKGLAVGMEPICYQAYGARRWDILTETYRKMSYLLLLVAFPISLLWSNVDSILLWLGQDHDITSVARIYMLYSIPDLFAQALYHPLRTFLRTQNINTPLTISATCAMILHVPINYFLVNYLKLGLRGVALASAWNSLNTIIGLIIYLLLSKTSLKPWDGSPARTCMKGWQPLLVFAGSSVLSVCLEWWWYEIMLLLCGLLSNPQSKVAAMGILIQTTSLLYVFPASLSSGLSRLVGHELGAGQPGRARDVSIVGLTIAVLWALFAFAFTILVRNIWGKLYTRETQILTLTTVTLPIVGFCELGNCPQTAACGILIGSARPNMGCLINFISFYIIGLPCAALFSFKLKLDFAGLWYGLAAAQFSCVCLMVWTLVRTNWPHQATRAKELTQASEGCINDLQAHLLS